MTALLTRNQQEVISLQSQTGLTTNVSLYDLRQAFYAAGAKMLSQNDWVRAYLQSQTGLTQVQSLGDLWRQFFIGKGVANQASLTDMANYFFTNVGFTPAVTTLVNESMASAPTTGTVDTNTTPGWNAGGYYVFNTGGNQYSDLYYSGDLGANFTMLADMKVPGSGADAEWFFWGWNARPHSEGDSTSAGYLLERNEFDGNIRLRWAGTEIAVASWVLDTNFDTLKLIATGNEFKVYQNGSLLFDFTDIARTLPGTTYGWGARSGGTGNTHEIKNILLTQP